MKFLALFSTLIFCTLTGLLHSQDEADGNSKEGALNVFIDCNFCDLDYIRKNISFVNYVRDRKIAQVHVLTTSQRTGSGGREYTFNFIGQLDFEGQNDTLSTIVKADATPDERRSARTKILSIGLIRYVAKTPMVEHLSINYTNESDSAETSETVDKWDFWVFRLSANGWFDGQEVYKSRSMNASVSANRITEKWKFENWGNFGYNEDSYKLDSVTRIVNSNQNYFFETSAVRAINNHWSAGLVYSANSSTFRNIEFNHQLSPAIEYNIFDYSEFTRKQIRLQYRIGVDDFTYIDTTIYNNIHESLFSHRISIAAEFNQKWGTISMSTTASQYLHDPALRKLTIWWDLSWRIVKGLQFNVYGGVDFIQDQISLPKGGATDVEILTQQRQLATQYSYWGSLGISYTFGSIYNNIVNPRFGN